MGNVIYTHPHFRNLVAAIVLGLLLLAGCTPNKSTTLLNNPSADVNFTTLDITLKEVATGNEASFKLLPRNSGDPWVFQAIYTDSVTGAEIARQLVIPQTVVNAFDIRDKGNGLLSIQTQSGDPTGFDGTVAVSAGPGQNEVTYKGFINKGAQKMEYAAITDPAPLVIVAVAAVGAIVCELLIAVTDCSDSQAILQSIEACRESGGKPHLTITTTFGVRFDPFRLGCGTDCEFECK